MVFKKATTAVRSGLNNDAQYGGVVPPIALSSTYNFIKFNTPGVYDYSRRRNPTRDIVQNTLATLENGKKAILTSSGMSAIHLLCMTFLTPGDLIIAPHDCYGGSYRLFINLAKKGFYKVKFINQNNQESLISALNKNPKLIFIETPSNPLLRVVDISYICRLCTPKTLSVVDNTFMSPALQQPLNLGADLVIHSCTKYLNGHSDLVAGVIVAKDQNIAEELSWWSNTLGLTAGAFDCYQLLRGIRTLIVRVEQQQNNAQKIVDFLRKKSQVKALYYPGLVENIGYHIACKQQKGFGAMLSFELHGNEKTLCKFLSTLKLFTLAESFGGVESLIAHPATMTHSGISIENRKYAGINDMLLRLSIGIEHYTDLIKDLEQAFQAVK